MKKTFNVQPKTDGARLFSYFDVERWTLDVERFPHQFPRH